MNEYGNCGCTIFPCTDEIAFMFKGLTEHHPSCIYAPKRYVWNLIAVIRDLVNGIDAWAADEDGVHPATWDALVAARKITQPVQGGEVIEHLEKLCIGESPCDDIDEDESAKRISALEAENATLRGMIEERVKEWDWFTQPGSAGEDCTDDLVERMRAAISPKQMDIGG